MIKMICLYDTCFSYKLSIKLLLIEL